MKQINMLRATVMAAVFAAGSAAWATDGYFPHGFGMKSKGMGGASVAVIDNAFAGINNPAASVWADTVPKLEWTFSVLSAARRVRPLALAACSKAM